MEKQQNSNGKKLSGARRQKIMMLGIVTLMLISMISMVSAAQFDNVKNIKETWGHSEKYKDIVIENTFGFGKDLWKGSLKEHDDTCGQDCESQIDIELTEAGTLIDDIKFETIIYEDVYGEVCRDVPNYVTECNEVETQNNNTNGTKTYNEVCSQVLKDYTNVCNQEVVGEVEVGRKEEDVRSYTLWLEQEVTQIQVPEYITECEEEEIYDATNDTTYTQTTCEQVLDGYSTEDTPQWIKYNLGEVLPKGDYTIKLEASKKSSRSVDWIIQSQGEWLNEWATWGGIDLETGVVRYFHLEDDLSTTVVIDESGTANGTATVNSDTMSTSAVVNNGFDMSGADGAIYVDTGSALLPATANFTTNMWVKPVGDVEEIVIDQYAGGQGGRFLIIAYAVDGDMKISLGGDTIMNYAMPIDSDWHMITLTRTGSNWELFLDGTSVDTTVDATGIYQMNTRIGSDNSARESANVDEVGFWNIILSQEQITSLYGGGSGRENVIGTGTITLNSPEDDYISSTPEVTFNASATVTGGATLTNMSLWHNGTGTWHRNYTQVVTGSTNTTTINATFGEGNYLVGWEACDSDGDCGFSTENRTVSVDTINPLITINNPTSTINYGSLTANETLNWSVTDAGTLDSIWWDYNNTNTTVYGTENQTTFTLQPGDYNGTLWANDSAGNINSSTINWVYNILKNSETYNATTYETASETYSINVTANTSLTAADLIWNGSSYSGTQSGELWSATIDIPTGSANKSFYWDFTYAGDTISSASQDVEILNTNFSICGGDGGSVPYLNFSFKDESDDSVIANGTIPSSTFEYWLGDGTVNKTLTYINNTGNPSYGFCATPADRSLTIDGLIQYEDQEGTYVQRLLNPDEGSFSNATTNTTLYLLKATDGIYVTFQVIDPAETPISGVIVTGTRILGGTTTVVASGTTDAAGAVTFFLDSDFEHTFTFESTGRDDYVTSIYPTQSSYTINLGGSSSSTTANVLDLTKGIDVKLQPLLTQLTNDTTYNFNITLISSYYTVSEFGFVLFNSSGSSVASASTSANGGIASTNYNVGNTTEYITMNYYWVIGGNYTNRTDPWPIIDDGGTEYSIDYFFTDLNNYFDSNLFGMGAFAKGIIVFIIIFFIVGIMSYKFGMVSPAGVSAVIFGVVAFFDVGVGIIPNPATAVPNFPTIFMGIILVGIMFREIWR